MFHGQSAVYAPKGDSFAKETGGGGELGGGGVERERERESVNWADLVGVSARRSSHLNSL